MRTISRHLPRSRRGDNVATCSYCGATWYRGQMVRDADGNYACPDDAPGLVKTELDRENEAMASRRKRPQVDNGPLSAYVTETAPPDKLGGTFR